MKTKLFKIGTAIILALTLTLCFPITVHATNETSQATGDIFEDLKNNIRNARVDEEDVANVNEELFGDRNYNPLANAKNSLTKFINSFRGKDYDSKDFDGNAGKVYDGIADGAEKVVNSGALDTIYNFGKSAFNLLTRIVGSAAEAVS